MAITNSEVERVKGDLVDGVIVLKMNFNQELMLAAEAGSTLAHETLACYREIRRSRETEIKTTSCIAVIVPRVAGSPVVRALFELWREVVDRGGGQIICVDYPEAYLESLTQLGLPSLIGFSLANSLDEAMRSASVNE